MLYKMIIQTKRNQFYSDVRNGLMQEQKALPSKYFYDEEGDQIFQEIMALKAYYPTDCEEEILCDQVGAMASVIRFDGEPFDIIELGAGDGSKTLHLLKYLLSDGQEFSYLPVDISGHILHELHSNMQSVLPDLDIKLIADEYLNGLRQAVAASDRRKVVLFLGANIGNFMPDQALAFCRDINQILSPGDLLLIGFDLKKDPRIIRAAYDDDKGVTRRFNLNLLTRINKELEADFDLSKFEHYCSYDPASGACKSYLISLENQRVHFPGYNIDLSEGECIWTEISQKYAVQEITTMANAAGYSSQTMLTDAKGWFASVIWRVCTKIMNTN